jgi:ring-1,2-phenylacetyl-CoA epoxidase subunit PaaC
MTFIIASPSPHVEYLLRLGDSSLVLGQRLAEWTGHGPVLEEDIALTNIALDLTGQARLLLTHAGMLEGAGRDEDALAYFRDVPAFRNVTLVELPNSGIEKGHGGAACYAFTVTRNLLYCAWQAQLWEALAGSTDAELAAIAAKSAKETAYHLRHAADWLVRFGDGTADSHARAQRALDQLLPYTNELFATDAVEEAVAVQGIGVRSAELRAGWEALVGGVIAEATLAMPPTVPFRSTGKEGLHSEHLDYLLTEMQSLARAHPGAQW